MDTHILKILCVILAAAFVLIPSAITSMTEVVFSETLSRIFLSAGILFVMAYVLIDIKNVSKKKAMGKLAACVGLLYALVMQWI